MVSVGGDNVPDNSQFAAWEQAALPLFDSIPLKDPSSYSCTATSYLVDQLIFTRTAFDKMQFVRSPHKLTDSSTDWITLQYYETGQIQGNLANGTPLLMQSDRISIHDFAHAYSGVGYTSNNFSITIPRHLVASHGDIYKEAPMFSWLLTSSKGRILLSAWQTLWQELPQASQADAPALASGFMGLLNGLLMGQWDEKTSHQLEHATLKSMQDYICRHLQQPTLGVSQLCQTFHCSRAKVYRLFQPFGGVKAFIQSQRLNGCYQHLCQLDASSKLKIGDVMAKWGFTNAAHFSRLFKQTFGITPSEAKEMSPLLATTPVDKTKTHQSEIQLLKSWFEQCR